MGMAVILFNGAEPFEHIVNILSTEGPMWNLVKIGQVVSKKTFKDFSFLYMYIAQGQGQIPPPPPPTHTHTKVTVDIQFYFFNLTL